MASRSVLFVVLLTLVSVGNRVNAEQSLEIKKGMSIFGSSELPTGLTIIPWRIQPADSAVGALQFTVVDEIFQPIERDVLQRQIDYYQQLSPAVDDVR